MQGAYFFGLGNVGNETGTGEPIRCSLSLAPSLRPEPSAAVV